MDLGLSHLKRYPPSTNPSLQAWDSADELLLQHANTEKAIQTVAPGKVLIVNDTFGALSYGLRDLKPHTYTDSFLSAEGIKSNLLTDSALTPIFNSLDSLTGSYDFVFIRVPKNMSFFEDILCHLTPLLHAHSKIICGAMVKHLAKVTFALLQKYVGDTSTELAHKKARLVFASPTLHKIFPSPYPLRLNVPPFSVPFVNHSNLFSREKLDIGTRFLIDSIPSGHRVILDLGCGNGIVGLAAGFENPNAKLIFADESWMAVESARINFENFFNDSLNTSAQFFWGNSFTNKTQEPIDLVLCNPPFHQGTSLDSWIAPRMFKDAYQSLIPGGRLRVVGNHHLNYPWLLNKLFGNSQIVARNSKFTITDSFK